MKVGRRAKRTYWHGFTATAAFSSSRAIFLLLNELYSITILSIVSHPFWSNKLKFSGEDGKLYLFVVSLLIFRGAVIGVAAPHFLDQYGHIRALP